MDDEERSLWQLYRATKPADAHREIFFRYVPWARSVARDVYRRVRVPQAEWGDYAHQATIGLLEAMGRFDPNRGVDFIGFARARVRGSVFNGLRSYLQEYAHRQENRRDEDRLESWLPDGGDLLDQMIGSVTGLGIAFLLDGVVQNGDLQTDEPSRIVEQHQMDRMLKHAMSRLPERERLVISLHYQEHIAFIEIAKMLGVTKGRISQIHRAAIERIREEVAPRMLLDRLA